MAPTEVLSVRLTAEARRVLAESASTHDAAGASALARDILEAWAAARADEALRAGIERAASFLREHPDWGDDPEDFFQGVMIEQ